MAEYAACYGGLPSPDDPWPVVYALLRRLGRFESRGLLKAMDASSAGVSRALSAAFGGDAAAYDEVRRDLAGKAYPGTETDSEDRYLVNQAAETDG